MSYISYLVKQEPDRAFIKEDRVHKNFVIFFWLFLQFNIPSIDSIYYLFIFLAWKCIERNALWGGGCLLQFNLHYDLFIIFAIKMKIKLYIDLVYCTLK